MFKKFSRPWCKSVTVVNNADVDIFANQITVLVGPSGAGKTTLLSMLVGYCQPSAGTIEVDGNQNAEDYRDSIGYCPQYDIDMETLTCQEELYFFGVVSKICFV